jgi:hypothetical protein
MGQVEPAGGDDLRVLGESFSADTRLTDLLLSIVASPTFVERVSEAAKP